MDFRKSEINEMVNAQIGIDIRNELAELKELVKSFRSCECPGDKKMMIKETRRQMIDNL